MPFSIDEFALVHGRAPGIRETHIQERHLNQYAEAFTRAATRTDLESAASISGVLDATMSGVSTSNSSSANATALNAIFSAIRAGTETRRRVYLPPGTYQVNAS